MCPVSDDNCAGRRELAATGRRLWAVAADPGSSSDRFLLTLAQRGGQGPAHTHDRLGMEEVAAAVGFGTAHALRHHFRSRVSLTFERHRKKFMSIVASDARDKAAILMAPKPTTSNDEYITNIIQVLP